MKVRFYDHVSILSRMQLKLGWRNRERRQKQNAGLTTFLTHFLMVVACLQGLRND